MLVAWKGWQLLPQFHGEKKRGDFNTKKVESAHTCHVSSLAHTLPILPVLSVSWSNTQIRHILQLHAFCLQILLLCLESTARAKITYCTFQSTAFSVAWILSSEISPGEENKKKMTRCSPELRGHWDQSCEKLFMGIIPTQGWWSGGSTHSEALPSERAASTLHFSHQNQSCRGWIPTMVLGTCSMHSLSSPWEEKHNTPY